MTLDEAINHCTEVADLNCNECGLEHRQLAEWLKELKALRERSDAEPKKNYGNAAAMREALVKLNKLLYVGIDGYVYGQPDMTDEIERTIKSALSAPLRN